MKLPYDYARCPGWDHQLCQDCARKHQIERDYRDPNAIWITHIHPQRPQESCEHHIKEKS